MKLLILALTYLATTVALADMPKLDKKESETHRAEKCAAWAREEVTGISDAKKKGSEFKEKFQQCLSKNGLPTSLAFSGKYKP